MWAGGKSSENPKPRLVVYGTNGRVFCTDSLVDVAFLFALEAVQHIPAQNIHVAGLGYLVREVFDLNRRIHLTLRPQRR